MTSAQSSTQFLLNFCRQIRTDFRSAEIDGLSKLHNIPDKMRNELQACQTPFAICSTSNIENIHCLLNRSFLIKTASKLIALGSTYDELHFKMKEQQKSIESLVQPNQTFSIWIDSIGKKLPQEYKVAKMEELAFLDIRGKIRLTNPDVCFYLLEYYGEGSLIRPEKPLQVFFGVLIGKGEMRHLPPKYDLKLRNYIGNTSMDPLLSFLATNMAAVTKNSMVYDPFVGTGSLLTSAAHFGAYCFGNDINYNVIHGRGKSSRSGVKLKQKNEKLWANFDQYGSTSKFLGAMVADSSRSGVWRHLDQGLFDAIITDPPYGIREKAIKVGMKENQYEEFPNLASNHPVRYPAKVKYSFYETFLDLLEFAAENLVIGGRLVYWLPIMYQKFDSNSIPQHPALELKCQSEQKLSGSHGRLLICMEKVKMAQKNDRASVENQSFVEKSLRDQVFDMNLAAKRKNSSDL